MEGEFKKYRQIPSSLPGGDLVVVSEGRPMRALVCICGEPVPLGTLRRQQTGDLKGFLESVQAAIHYREQTDRQTMIDSVASKFASRTVLEHVIEELQKLEKVVGLQIEEAKRRALKSA